MTVGITSTSVLCFVVEMHLAGDHVQALLLLVTTRLVDRFTYLFTSRRGRRVREGERPSQRGVFHPLVYFSDTLNSWGWAISPELAPPSRVARMQIPKRCASRDFSVVFAIQELTFL